MELVSRLELSIEDGTNGSKLRIAGVVSTPEVRQTATYAELVGLKLDYMAKELIHVGLKDYTEIADCAARLVIALEQSARLQYGYQNLNGGWDGNYQTNYLISQALLDRARRALQKLDLPNNKQRYS